MAASVPLDATTRTTSPANVLLLYGVPPEWEPDEQHRVAREGRRLGTATVSDKHANFIQADDGGSADDVLALMTEVRGLVEASSGFRLRSEIRLVGFDEGDVF